MPFAEREDVALWNDPDVTQQNRANMMYDAAVYCERHGDDVWYIKALRPFAFPNDLDFPFIDWVKYSPATEKVPQKWTILQPELCYKLQRNYHLHCINGSFFCDDGYMADDAIRAIVTRWVLPFVLTNVARTVVKVFDALRNICHTDTPVPNERKVYTKGGYTLTLQNDGSITKEYQPDALTVNRLPVRYDETAGKPEKFLAFLHDLLNDDDINVVQEYAGYMLIPTTASQKALFLRCDGGGGKSVLLDILSCLFGGSSITGKLQQLACGRFALATLENKLAFFDDDLSTALLQETGLIKSIITANSPLQAQRKGKDAFPLKVFARLMVAGNVFPGAAHDRSDGLYRRLLLIECKPKPANRIDDPYLSRKIIADEMPGVLLWALQGLQRWQRNGCIFHESDLSHQLVKEKQLADNPVQAFMQDDGWIVYDADAMVTTDKLVTALCLWCSYNAVTVPALHSVTMQLARQAKKHDAKATQNMVDNGKRKRGYKGIGLTRYAAHEIDASIGQPFNSTKRLHG